MLSNLQAEQNSQMKPNQALTQETALIIFLMTAINQVFIVSLAVILIKKVKLLLKANCKKYYFFISFYMMTKMVLCVILEIKMLSAKDFQEIDSQFIENVFKNALVFADCSILSLFMASFEYYLAVSLAVIGDHRFSRLIRIVIWVFQILMILCLFIPLTLFNTHVIEYGYLNTCMCSFNLLAVAAFFAAFFFLNFKMTGLLIEKRLNIVIKKVYKLLVAILFSRIVMAALEIVVALKIENGFEDYISIIQNNEGQILTLGACFILYLLIVLLTQGIPLMLSLRRSIALSFVECSRIRREPPSFISTGDSMMNEEGVCSDLLTDFEECEDANKVSHMSQSEKVQGDKESTSRLRNIQSIDSVNVLEKINCSHSGAFRVEVGRQQYFLREVENVSNYIIEQITNEIESLAKLEIKAINKIRIFQKAGKIYTIENFMQESLESRMDKLLTLSDKLEISIQLAEAIKELHAKNYAHGAINPNNVMFDRFNRISLTGYGLHSLRKYLSLTAEYSNITIYTAVELMGSGRQKTISKPSLPADIYSFGIIFYQIFSQKRNYRKLNLSQIITKFKEQSSRPKIPESLAETLKQVMRKCWQDKPESRPGIEWLVSYLRGIRNSL